MSNGYGVSMQKHILRPRQRTERIRSTSRRGSGCDKNHTIHIRFFFLANDKLNASHECACAPLSTGVLQTWRRPVEIIIIALPAEVQNAKTHLEFHFFHYCHCVMCIHCSGESQQSPLQLNISLLLPNFDSHFFVFFFPFPGNALMDFNCAKHIFTCSCCVRFHHTRVTATAR